MAQLDSKTVSALRTVLDDVCSHLPLSSISARTFVASRILERAKTGDQTFDELKQAGLEALRVAPTMGR
jgi:hypothetical protein